MSAGSPNARRGYTLVEIIVALGVLSVGAAGVIAIQKATGIGNINSRNLATANRIAAKWAERLSFDALQWNEANGFGDTYWLKDAGVPPSTWMIPAEVPRFGSPDADVLGADIFAAEDPSPPAFCTHLRLSAMPGNARAIRAEIRVFWVRNGSPVDCALDPSLVTTTEGRFGIVHKLAGVVASR